MNLPQRQLSGLEDRMLEITEAEQKKELKKKKNEDSLRDLWDNIKCTNLRVMVVPEEEDQKKGSEKILEEILVKKFPNMGKEIVTKVQEAPSFVQHKPKEEHTEKIINHTNKN